MSEAVTRPELADPVPRSPVDDFIPGGVLSDENPLAQGILMKHQVEWLEDKSDLKLAEKGRRTGITYAEALGDVLTAAAKRSAGGDNVWYIGDTKEKGREFIQTCAHFAKIVSGELLEIEEFLFEERQEDGSSKHINSFRITFASGFKISALSSRPANIRGLQGIVVIDEAAFHPDVRGVIDACNAMLIWGGKIRIISTHNGATNPFAELIKETRAGRYDYSIHHIPFDQAVENGLYERVCLIRGEKPTPEGKAVWYRKIRRSYGSRTEAMREELDAIPREGEGVALPLAWIEACQTKDYRVIRWTPPVENFVDLPERLREQDMRDWLLRHVEPALAEFTGRRVWAGSDFAMRQDRTALGLGYTGEDLTRHMPLLLELRQAPYAQQKQAFSFVFSRIRLTKAIMDANGNGMVLAQEMRQQFGQNRILELTPHQAWYRDNGSPLRTAFEDRTILIPADLDVRNDLRELRTIDGVIKLPKEVRTTGTDDGKRHGDAAMAIMYAYAASREEPAEYGYTPAPKAPRGFEGAASDTDRRLNMRPDHSDDYRPRNERGAW